MYDREKDLSWKKFKDISFYAAMGCAGGGRNEVDPRFISMFSVYNIVFPNDESLQQIYTSIFGGHLQYSSSFDSKLLPIADIIVQMTLRLFKVSTVASVLPLPKSSSGSSSCLCNGQLSKKNGVNNLWRCWSRKFMANDLHMQITSIFHNLCQIVYFTIENYSKAIQWKNVSYSSPSSWYTPSPYIEQQ